MRDELCRYLIGDIGFTPEEVASFSNDGLISKVVLTLAEPCRSPTNTEQFPRLANVMPIEIFDDLRGLPD